MLQFTHFLRQYFGEQSCYKAILDFMQLWVRLATIKILESVDAVVGLELLAPTLADKHMATVLPN